MAPGICVSLFYVLSCGIFRALPDLLSSCTLLISIFCLSEDKLYPLEFQSLAHRTFMEGITHCLGGKGP